MTKYRILHIVPALYSGGVGSFLLNYYRIFNKNEFQFDFITHYEERDKVDIDPLLVDSHVYFIKQQHQIGVFRYIKQFKSIIKGGQYDIIHIHIGHLTGVISMICKWYGARLTVCHAHTTRCMNLKMSRLMPVFRWACLFSADCLMACGYEAGKFCFGTENFVVIPNGVDFDIYQKSEADQILRLKQNLGINEQAFVVGCVAAFTPPKNHFFLIKVFKAIYERYSNAVLLLVGDGELRYEVERQVFNYGLQNNVIFTGAQTDIPLFLSALDVFLLPSIHEGLPVVAAEAQAIGVKCVFSKQIDSSCDRNVGLMTFLPITDSCINLWVDAALKPGKCLSQEYIKTQFARDNYDIRNGAILFQNEYRKLRNK